MQLVLLSGGSGKRLWPLSNDSRSKQFLKLLKDDNGKYESMVQRIYRQIIQAGINADVTIATNMSQLDSIRSQLGDKVDIVIEPERRDTFPAIALACSYLYSKKGIGEEEVIVVLPIDPYTSDEYFKILYKMEALIKDDIANLVLMGIDPTSPSDKYGYIVPKANRNNHSKDYYEVKGFKEKPDSEKAEELIREGAFWNGGVFAFKMKYLLRMIEKYHLSVDSDLLKLSYDKLPKASFDYEVVERESSIAMVPYYGNWKDLGTWNTFTEEIRDNSIGNVIMDEYSYNTTVINECSKPVVVMGASNMVIAVSPDGILVTDKYRSGYIKTYVDRIDSSPMSEEKIWGTYNVMDSRKSELGAITKVFSINADRYLEYRISNVKRIWTIVSGRGFFVLNDEIKKVNKDDVLIIEAGMRYGLRAICDIDMIEIQLGENMEEEPEQSLDWSWDKL